MSCHQIWEFLFLRVFCCSLSVAHKVFIASYYFHIHLPIFLLITIWKHIMYYIKAYIQQISRSRNRVDWNVLSQRRFMLYFFDQKTFYENLSSKSIIISFHFNVRSLIPCAHYYINLQWINYNQRIWFQKEWSQREFI